MSTLKVRSEIQQNPVAEHVSALIAVTRPILQALLFALKREIVAVVGGHNEVQLKLLPRLYRPGDGDCGICYEYAIHDAIRREDPMVVERVYDAMTQCRVPGDAIASILFGAEKTGAVQLIDTASEVLTDDSRLLTGLRSQPPKLKTYLNMLAAAFSRPATRLALPSSINGLWKADLFLGCTDSDRWVGTTVKVNASHLEGARGLRIGIVPADQGRTDRIRRDDQRNLVICPIPYDGSFMELFFSAWHLMKQFLNADAMMPPEVALPIATHRQVVRELQSRRDFAVIDVIEALRPLAQPELLVPREEQKALTITRREHTKTDTVIAPVSKLAE